jgi:hypothetical protein
MSDPKNPPPRYDDVFYSGIDWLDSRDAPDPIAAAPSIDLSGVELPSVGDTDVLVDLSAGK